jgi:phytoene synthase
MRRFGVNEKDIIERNYNENVRSLIKFQVDRAKIYYEEARPGIKYLHRGSRFAIYAAGSIYGKILNKIEENDYNPFLGRVHVPRSEKISILFGELIKSKLNLNL